jgi:hypothetical protein
MDKKSGGTASASTSASSSASRPAMEPVGAGASSKGANL